MILQDKIITPVDILQLSLQFQTWFLYSIMMIMVFQSLSYLLSSPGQTSGHKKSSDVNRAFIVFFDQYLWSNVDISNKVQTISFFSDHTWCEQISINEGMWGREIARNLQPLTGWRFLSCSSSWLSVSVAFPDLRRPERTLPNLRSTV